MVDTGLREVLQQKIEEEREGESLVKNTTESLPT